MRRMRVAGKRREAGRIGFTLQSPVGWLKARDDGRGMISSECSSPVRCIERRLGSPLKFPFQRSVNPESEQQPAQDIESWIVAV